VEQEIDQLRLELFELVALNGRIAPGATVAEGGVTVTVTGRLPQPNSQSARAAQNRIRTSQRECDFMQHLFLRCGDLRRAFSATPGPRQPQTVVLAFSEPLNTRTPLAIPKLAFGERYDVSPTSGGRSGKKILAADLVSECRQVWQALSMVE
jgi:hypothetical protein